MPATGTRMSTRPKVSMARSTTRSSAAWSRTSATMAMLRRPVAVIIRSVSRRSSSTRACRSRRYRASRRRRRRCPLHLSASLTAAARPSPRAPPVTTATRSSNRPMVSPPIDVPMCTRNPPRQSPATRFAEPGRPSGPGPSPPYRRTSGLTTSPVAPRRGSGAITSVPTGPLSRWRSAALRAVKDTFITWTRPIAQVKSSAIG